MKPFRPIAPAHAFLISLGIGVAVVALILAAGCATMLQPAEPQVFAKGCRAPGGCLATIVLGPPNGPLEEQAFVVVDPHGGARLLVHRALFTRQQADLIAHELCHVVAAYRGLPQALCHVEDGGVIR